MKFLGIDPHGDGLDVAMRAVAAGHDVRWFIRDQPRTRNIGAGLVPLIRDFTASLHWADLIFMCDNALYLRQLDAFRAYRPNALIIGPTFEAAQWELDRRTGFKVFADHGIEVAPFREFQDYDVAIRYVKVADKRLVSKPCGDADKSMTYCAGGPDPVADMIYMLEKWKKRFGKPKDHFVLQDFIEGIEMSADGWFGPGGFDCGWCEGYEFKKLMPGDYGVNTGEMGSVFYFTRRSKLARQVLEPLGEALANLAYTGYISCNTIIDDHGQPWPLEFTVRPGWPSLNIEAELHTIDDPVERLYSLAKGEDCRSIQLDRVALGVVVALPSFPHGHALSKEIDGIPVHGITDRLWPHLHPCQMRRGSNGTELETAGDYTMVITASSETVSGAREVAYRRVGQIHISGGMCVRNDVGQRLSKQLPKLHAMGYALGLEY